MPFLWHISRSSASSASISRKRFSRSRAFWSSFAFIAYSSCRRITSLLGVLDAVCGAGSTFTGSGVKHSSYVLASGSVTCDCCDRTASTARTNLLLAILSHKSESKTITPSTASTPYAYRKPLIQKIPKIAFASARITAAMVESVLKMLVFITKNPPCVKIFLCTSIIIYYLCKSVKYSYPLFLNLTILAIHTHLQTHFHF